MRRRPRSLAIFGALLTALACGCAGSASSIPADAPRSAVPIERLFPILDGHVYSYAMSGDPGESGEPAGSVLIARVSRTGPSTGELRWGASSKRFEYRPDGVADTRSGAYILKSPLAIGASWRGDRGLIRVTSIDASPVVPAGRFASCVETVEERRGDSPIQITTIFCPDVGVVVLQASSGMGVDRAELRSYAPPVDLGPDGLTVTKP
jgi:hypothetical protein